MESGNGEGDSTPPPAQGARGPGLSGANAPLGGRFGHLGEVLRGRAAPGRGGQSRTEAQRQIVNGLDEREWRYSLAAAVLAIGLVIATYLTDRRSTVKTTHEDAGTLLVAGIIFVAVMVIGLLLRRRALVGFANFMVGFEFISSKGGNILGLVFLGFGGWLLIRALRYQRDNPKARGARSRPARERNPVPAAPAAPPKPSKRYTPPRRSKPAGRRK